jgi:hypothetical protein
MAMKPRPFDIRRRVLKRAGGGSRMGTIVKLVGPNDNAYNLYFFSTIEVVN